MELPGSSVSPPRCQSHVLRFLRMMVVLKEVATALAYMHSNEITHNDMKWLGPLMSIMYRTAKVCAHTCIYIYTHTYIYKKKKKSSVSQNHESWPFSCDGYPKNNKFAMGVNGCASLCSALEHGKHEHASIGSFGFPNVQCNSMEWGWNLVALRNTGYWDMWWREMGLKIHLGWFG